ncbi:RNA polymerase sigma factor [Plebeiibacterium marinum]|uniref:RNA polymerase sigma-70 factor n=1 Tax=Plebeiibacterium marinum TaxID=2992111 RepID=A0AAE3MDP3_9BACT|nr:RNA polymerase sigma-70 factor [Plebeiobacterium marinum]MCW3805634.1 RNA polymerase sigma-70 factor [Plebeiobacterium marinum]
MKAQTSDSDAGLVLQLKNNNIEAFDSLYHRYSEKLYNFAYSFLKNHEDCKEIIQETFIRLWEKKHQIDTTKSFKSYLFKISYNLIIDQLRNRLKDKKYQEFLAHHFQSAVTEFESNIDYDIIKDKIGSVLEELPEKRKQIFLLSREEGLSHKEIAEKLSISEKTVENQIGLSLKYLRSRLSKDFIAILLFIALFS